MNRIVRPDKTPRRTAHDMILEMVKFSNYGSGRFRTDADIKRYLQSLFAVKKMVMKKRNIKDQRYFHMLS